MTFALKHFLSAAKQSGDLFARRFPLALSGRRFLIAANNQPSEDL